MLLRRRLSVFERKLKIVRVDQRHHLRQAIELKASDQQSSTEFSQQPLKALTAQLMSLFDD